MNKDIILDFIYSIICLLVLFILKHLNKQIEREFTEKLKVENDDSSETLYCFAKTKKSEFYINQNKMSFKIVGFADLKDKNSSDKTIILSFKSLEKIS